LKPKIGTGLAPDFFVSFVLCLHRENKTEIGHRNIACCEAVLYAVEAKAGRCWCKYFSLEGAPMADQLKQFRRRHIYPLFRPFFPYRKNRFAAITVYYEKHLDGGGRGIGQGFIPFLQSRGMPKQRRVFEWCAGPGFIGFSLLAHNLCETLCLADINPEAVAACRRSIEANRLADCVSVYHSDNLKSIPASERWDLVVSNPPHFVGATDEYSGDLRAHDPEWSVHREFFATVKPFLSPGGVIILQENDAAPRRKRSTEWLSRPGSR
jgi:16S rRNA G966 N2-methylase RsmD